MRTLPDYPEQTHEAETLADEAVAPGKPGLQGEEMYRLIVEKAREGIWLIDEGTRTRYVNDCMARMLGYDAAEMIGRDILDFVGEEGKRRALQNLAQRRAGLGDEYDFEFRKKDGGRLMTHMATSAIFDDSGVYAGGLAMVTDITRHLDVQGQLARSELRFSAALDALPFPVLIWTDGGQVAFVNRAWTGLTGYRLEDIPTTADWVGKAFVGRQGPILKSIVERMGSTEARHLGVYELANASGRNLVWDFSTTPIGQLPDGRMAFIISAVDITARVGAEREAEERRKLLIRSERLASLGVLVAGMAHEVNSPNHTIALTANLLGEVWASARMVLDEALEGREDVLLGGIEYAELREELPKLIRGVQEASSHIDSLVQGLKGFAKTDEGMEIAEVDINAVVTASLTIMKPQLRRSTDQLSVELAAELPRTSGDFNRLEQVLVNLLQNACQALTDRSQPIAVTSGFDSQRGMITITVRDGGIGMSPEVIEHMREPFYTTKRASGGLGLGISISVSILEELGGSLDYESESGEGTTAILRLPVAGAVAKAAVE
jgi:PAS domain S-box-containing protein